MEPSQAIYLPIGSRELTREKEGGGGGLCVKIPAKESGKEETNDGRTKKEESHPCTEGQGSVCLSVCLSVYLLCQVASLLSLSCHHTLHTTHNTQYARAVGKSAWQASWWVVTVVSDPRKQQQEQHDNTRRVAR